MDAVTPIASPRTKNVAASSVVECESCDDTRRFVDGAGDSWPCPDCLFTTDITEAAKASEEDAL